MKLNIFHKDCGYQNIGIKLVTSSELLAGDVNKNKNSWISSVQPSEHG